MNSEIGECEEVGNRRMQGFRRKRENRKSANTGNPKLGGYGKSESAHAGNSAKAGKPETGQSEKFGVGGENSGIGRYREFGRITEIRNPINEGNNEISERGEFGEYYTGNSEANGCGFRRIRGIRDPTEAGNLTNAACSAVGEIGGSSGRWVN